MAEMGWWGAFRHLRADASAHILYYKGGRLRLSGRGAAFWFVPLSTSIAEVPIDDRDQPFLFHGRSVDFQDVTAQGTLTYRVVDPAVLAERVDFTIDLARGRHLKQPLEKIASLLAQRAERHAWGYIARTSLREILSEGQARLRDVIDEGLRQDPSLTEMGITVVAVSVSSVKPKPELDKALEAPMRERIQQEADEAAFARRALAVEKERAIQENELQNRIELARREEQLITQQGQNARRQATEAAEAARINVHGEAERTRVLADAQAANIQAVEGAKLESERGRMDVYKEVPPPVLLALAAQALARNLKRIDHVNLGADALGPMLQNLVGSAARRMEG
jgi:regulator of protease activity HflC (stomatin/prohibitin superfamily)